MISTPQCLYIVDPGAKKQIKEQRVAMNDIGGSN